MPCWEGKVSASHRQLKPPAPFPAGFLWLGGELGQEKEQVWSGKSLAGCVNISLVNHIWSCLAPSFAGGVIEQQNLGGGVGGHILVCLSEKVSFHPPLSTTSVSCWWCLSVLDTSSPSSGDRDKTQTLQRGASVWDVEPEVLEWEIHVS